MPTVDYLFFLMDIGAPLWRQKLAARGVMAKLLVRLPDECMGIAALRESI
jgi:hypothetical protein